MRIILPRYLMREIFKTFIPAFCGFGFLILLGLTIQLLHKGLDIIDIRVIVPYLMLYACPDAIPIAFLAATVMTYGQLSSSNEIVAIRTSGLSLNIIITPVIIVSFLLSFLTLYLNAEVLPKSNRKIKSLKESAVSSVLSRHISAVKKKIVFDPYHIYIGKVEDAVYKELAIIEYSKDFVTNILLAEEGTILMSDDKNAIILSLRNGDFAKMNYQKPKEIPRVGSFEEMSFEIPINKKTATGSKKYKTLFELFNDRKEIEAELADYLSKLNTKNEKDFLQTSSKKLDSYEKKFELVSKEDEKVKQQIVDIGSDISKFKLKMANIKNELHTIENQIAVSNINIERFKRNADDDQADVQNELDEINNTIIDYVEKQEDEKKEYLTIHEAVKEKEEELVVAQSKSAKLQEKIIGLEKSGIELKSIPRIKKLRRHSDSLTSLIHKRISSSFTCIAFILIGIPIGILAKNGNVLINFGISFLIVILVYYPLNVVGVIMSKGTLPIVPSIWGANIILTIAGIILFRRSLTR